MGEKFLFFRTGWVESKIRVFVKKLEFTPCLKTAHPHPTSFESKKENWSHCISWFVGLKFEPNRYKSFTFDDDDDCLFVCLFVCYIDIHIL